MKAFFFDRDGTLNPDEAGYINDPKEMHLHQSVPDVLKYLKLLEYKIFIITNQSGIGRRIIKPTEYRKVNSKFLTLAGGYNVIDDIMYCPHSPDQKCHCRKPKTFFFNLVKEHYNINFSKSYFVGDKPTDIICGKKAGLKTIMVFTGDLKIDSEIRFEKRIVKPDLRISSIEELLNIIVE